jgi:hypothetical protein
MPVTAGLSLFFVPDILESCVNVNYQKD